MSHMAPHLSGTEKLLQNGWLNSPLSNALVPSLGKLRVTSSRPDGAKRRRQLLGELVVNTVTRSPPGAPVSESRTTWVQPRTCCYVLKRGLTSVRSAGPRTRTPGAVSGPSGSGSAGLTEAPHSAKPVQQPQQQQHTSQPGALSRPETKFTLDCSLPFAQPCSGSVRHSAASPFRAICSVSLPPTHIFIWGATHFSFSCSPHHTIPCPNYTSWQSKLFSCFSEHQFSSEL